MAPVVQGDPSATELVVDWASVRPSSRSGWKELPSVWRIPGPGCYAWEVISAEGSTSIPFETWADGD